jgi:succinoglycan biosynthesis protein ExoU
VERLTKNSDLSVCVIIAAYNAAATIGRAVSSALAQAEVTEVIVIDDASTDTTAAAAQASDDLTGRLSVQRLQSNAGPSRARNIAIGQTKAPLIAILDSDDFFLPGRFAALLAIPDWDMIADNIVFVSEDDPTKLNPDIITAHRTVSRSLTAASFVQGSISRADRFKGELGFLKPVLARAFLDRHALRYAEEMRLSEDYDLYVRALIAGARFLIAPGCYYVAVERPGSLSVSHGVAELAAVDAAMARLRTAAPANDAALHDALKRHHAQIARKRRHRAVLARKREIGTLRALREQVQTPGQLAEILSDVFGDKLGLSPRGAAQEQDAPRFLL